MSECANFKVRAEVWVASNQVGTLRSVCYTTDAEYLQRRNEAIVTAVYDTGLRVGELVCVDVEFLRNDSSKLYLLTEVQKDYSDEHSSPPITLECSGDIAWLLSSCLANRRKDTPVLFPSHSPDRTSEQGACDTIHKIAEKAEIHPFRLGESRGTPGDVMLHILRHGIVYQMISEEEGNSLYDVCNCFHHGGIQMTERIYDYPLEV